MGKLKDDEYIFSVEDEKASITLNEGETLSSKIRVDCQKWLNEFTDATFEVFVRFQGSRTFHVAAHTEIVENILTWKPDTNDTLKPGIGWWQVRCISGEEIVALTRKWEMCVLPSVHATGVEEAVTKEYVDEALANKQDALTFDDMPTADSENPVTSGGVKAALDELTDKKVMNLKMEQSFDEQTEQMTISVSYADGAPVVTGLTVDDFVNHAVRIVVEMNGSQKTPMMYQQVTSMGGQIIVYFDFFQGEISFVYDPQTGDIANSAYHSWFEEFDILAKLTADFKYSQYQKGEYYVSGGKLAKRISDNTKTGTENTDYVFTNVGAELETLNSAVAALEEANNKTVLNLKLEPSFDEETGTMNVTVSYADGSTVVPGLTVEDFVNGDVRVNFATPGSESAMPMIYCSATPAGSSIAIQFAMPGEGVGFIGFSYDPQTGNISNGYFVQLASLELERIVNAIQHWISDYKYSNFHKNEYCINGTNFVKRISDNASMGTKDTDYIYTTVGAELESLTNTIASLEARIAALEGN